MARTFLIQGKLPSLVMWSLYSTVLPRVHPFGITLAETSCFFLSSFTSVWSTFTSICNVTAKTSISEIQDTECMKIMDFCLSLCSRETPRTVLACKMYQLFWQGRFSREGGPIYYLHLRVNRQKWLPALSRKCWHSVKKQASSTRVQEAVGGYQLSSMDR